MNYDLIADTLRQWLPRRKGTSSGWESFNCVMCQHNGEPTADTKRKGGIIFSGPSFTYRCFRCKFKAHWRPGMYVSAKLSWLLEILGVPESTIADLKRHAIEVKQEASLDDNFETSFESRPKFESITLPDGAINLTETINFLLEGGDLDVDNQSFRLALQYLLTRFKSQAITRDYYWAPGGPKDDLDRRVIIPFYWEGELVGYTARYAGDDPRKTKYISVQQNGYIYNNHYLDDYNRKYVVVAEGCFKADAISAVAILSNEITESQIAWLRSSGKEIIVLPDRDKKGVNKKLLECAIDNDFYVSFPDWEEHIKDADEAALHYGRIWTAKSVLDAKIKGETQILQRAKLWV